LVRKKRIGEKIMVHFQPFGPQTVRVLRDEVDRLFDSFASSSPGDVVRRFVQPQVFPAVNLWEQDDAVFVEAELPGVQGGDLDLSVTGDELLLKGKRTAPREGSQAYHRRERGEGEFARVVKLPVDVNADAVDATLENGVLLVRLPKAETVRPRKISISPRQS
jgi:HSP20 family protein